MPRTHSGPTNNKKKRTHPVDLRLKVEVPRGKEAADVEPVALAVLEARALVVEGVLPSVGRRRWREAKDRDITNKQIEQRGGVCCSN